MKMAHVIVEGLVQGVCFRDYTQRQAFILNLTGWVRNLSNGTVETVFSGTDQNRAKMLEWLKQGSPRSRVDNLIIDTVESDEKFAGFEIRYNR